MDALGLGKLSGSHVNIDGARAKSDMIVKLAKLPEHEMRRAAIEHLESVLPFIHFYVRLSVSCTKQNILDKFNPGARQMINAGKAYLKALHGAAAASRLYVDAITKLARQAQQGTWGGSSDIGSALMKIVEVYKEIQEQQMNI
ncbi:Insulin receptor substrate 53 kDa, partial [Carabus blaptoides fortunei]